MVLRRRLRVSNAYDAVHACFNRFLTHWFCQSMQENVVACFWAKYISISVGAASRDSDRRIIQDPSNRLNETYWHWPIGHKLCFNEIFDGKLQNFVVLIPDSSSNASDGRDANCCPWHSLILYEAFSTGQIAAKYVLQRIWAAVHDTVDHIKIHRS